MLYICSQSALNKGSKESLPCKCSFKSSFKKSAAFLCHLSLTACKEPLGTVCPSFPKPGKVSLALINTSGRGEVIWTLFLSITASLALPSLAQSLQQDRAVLWCTRHPKEGLGLQMLSNLNTLTLLLLPHLTHLELKDNTDLLGKLIGLADTNFKAVKCDLQAPWQQSLGSQITRQWECCHIPVPLESHSLLCSPVTDFYLFTQVSPLCPANKCFVLEPFRAMGAHTEGWYHNKCIITTKRKEKGV